MNNHNIFANWFWLQCNHNTKCPLEKDKGSQLHFLSSHADRFPTLPIRRNIETLSFPSIEPLKHQVSHPSKHWNIKFSIRRNTETASFPSIQLFPSGEASKHRASHPARNSTFLTILYQGHTCTDPTHHSATLSHLLYKNLTFDILVWEI